LENWRYIDLDITTLAQVHAIEEALAEQKNGNIFLLWRVDKPAMTIGYFQNVYEEIDVEKAKEMNVTFTRRLGGGGAGYLTSNVLAYSIIVDEQSKIMPKKVEETYAFICNGIVLALKELGISAVHIPINDVMIDGKKFSGSSQHRSFGMIVQHGFISAETDLVGLGKLIKTPKEKLQAKNIARIEDRITWINKEIEKAGKSELS
jgi:lipoate-protein ligase A